MNDKLTVKISLPHIEGSSQNIMLKRIFLLTEGLQQERFSSTKQLSQKISALLCNTKKTLLFYTVVCYKRTFNLFPLFSTSVSISIYSAGKGLHRFNLLMKSLLHMINRFDLLLYFLSRW